MKNKVVIIGGDHHNTLAVIRGFGETEVETEILIHSSCEKIKNLKVSHSKYARNLFLVKDNEESILNWLINNKDEEKKVIVPCSDLAEYVIDKNYNILKDAYFVPMFKEKTGKVCELMDKYEQKNWADKHGIPMAKSWAIMIKNGKFDIPKDIIYPCIIKPELSAFGKKGDIKIVDNYETLNEILQELSEKKYEMVLIQQFLNKKYEICAYGCIIKEEPFFIGCLIKKIRESLSPCIGSTIYGVFINDEKYLKIVQKILLTLYKEGYRGLYDLDLLVCEDNVYLNEINFRHGGNGYSLIKNGINAPYIYYLDSLNITYDKDIKLKYPNGHFIDDLEELRLFFKRYISLKDVFSELKQSFAFAKFDKNDLSGSFAFYNVFAKLRKKIKKVKN